MINGSDQAINATTTPTTPQIKNCLAAATSSALPCAVKNLKAAMTNMTMKNATAIGQRMANTTSTKSLIDNPGAAFGIGPGLKASITAGNAIKIVETEAVINFLFIYY